MRKPFSKRFVILAIITKNRLIEDIADYLHVSPGHFSRLFKRATRCTATEYLIKYRLRIAKELLAETDFSLGEAAQTAGFCSQSYFSKMFRRFEGMTPFEYRQSIRMEFALPTTRQ